MRFARLRYIVPLRLRSLMRRRAVERDLDDELQFHLEEEVDRLVALGASRTEAARRARQTLPQVDLVKERCRDARQVSWADTVAQDLRYAGRMLACSPGFTIVAALTLALGIGANTAVFSLVDGILMRPLPYPAPERLVSVRASYPKGAFAALRDELRTLDVGAYIGHQFTVKYTGPAIHVAGARVSAELFTVLGAQPVLGRTFRAGEDVPPADRVAIVAHDLWVGQFGGDRAIVGRTIVVDGVARQIVGVMPPGFTVPSARTRIWVPIAIDPRDTGNHWGGDFMPVVGRLRPGADAAAASAELRVFQSRIGGRFPWPMPEAWNRDISAVPLGDALVGDVRPRLLLLSAAAFLVLLVACANVANLSLSRAAAREREIGIRGALGAGPRRIARQLLTESLLLSAIGGLGGLLLSAPILTILTVVMPADTPRLGEVAFNWRMLCFTGAIAMGAGCLFGLAPVLQARRASLRAALDAGGRGAGRTVAGPFRAALTVAQIAAAVVLVIAAGLLVRSLWSLTHVDPAFSPDRVVTARLSPTDAVCASVDRCVELYRRVAARAAARPGITRAALVNTLPLTGEVAKRSIEPDNRRADGAVVDPLLWLNAVTAGYFDVMGIRIEAGRAFTEHDLSSRERVAIVAVATARRFWPGESALGRQIRFSGEQEWRTIVGVAADVLAYDLTRPTPDWMDGTLYVPYGASATLEDGRIPSVMTLVGRSRSDDAPALAELERALVAESDIVVSDLRPMASIVAEQAAAPSATASLLVSMAALALVLGSVGVYGVLSFLVSRRTHDLGIRLALGAQPRDILVLVLGEGARLCLAGIGIGVLGALALTRWLSSELYGVSATDPTTYAVVVSVVAAVTLIACYLPTRRAMAVNPLIVLRDS